MPRKPKKPDLDLVVAMDFGGSITKVCAVDPSGKYHLLAIDSEVAEVPIKALMDNQSFMGNSPPEYRAWIRLKNGDFGFAVGKFASQKFLVEPNLKESKLRSAVPKVLSALWILKHKLNLDNKFNIILGCLLPPAECSRGDIAELIETLIPALAEFETPEGVMRVKLSAEPVIFPEGAGVFFAERYLCNKDFFDSSNIGFLGIGYRNSNIFIARNGGILPADRYTSQFGFNRLVEGVAQEVGSVANKVDLAAVIGQCGYKIDRKYLEKYLIEIDRINRLDNIFNAIIKARDLYWQQLEIWFRQIEVDSLDRVLLYGGTVEYFRAALIERLKNIDYLAWHSESTIPVKLINSIIVDRSQSALNIRFQDCWCFLHSLCGTVDGFENHTIAKLFEEKA